MLLFLGFFIAVILTYYDLYKQKILKDKELDQYKKQNEFHFEFNDNSITTRDGRILLGVTFFSNIEVVVEKLELELDDRLFKPLDWATFKFKHIHTKNFTFNLTNLQDVNTDKYQDAKFIVVVDNIKHESRSFDIRKLL